MVVNLFSYLRAALVGSLIFLSGCAYHAGSVNRGIPGGYRQVAVPVFKNSTKEAGIEVYFTNSMIRELQRAHVGQITDKGDAQVTIEGTIDSVTYTPTNQVKSGDTTALASGTLSLPPNTILNTSYQIVVQCSLKLKRNSDQKVIWSGTFTGERNYLAPEIALDGLNSANALYNQSARYQNIEAIAADLMIEAHDRITENF